MAIQQSQADFKSKIKDEFFLAVKLWMWCKNVKHSDRMNEAAKAYIQSNEGSNEYPMQKAAIFFTEEGFYRHYNVAVVHGESVLKELDKESAWIFEVEKSKDCYDCE